MTDWLEQWNNVYPDWARGDIAEDGVQVVEGERDQVTRIVAHQHLQVGLTGFCSFFSIFEDDGQVVECCLCVSRCTWYLTAIVIRS